MCLAIPMKVLSVEENSGLVEAYGVKKNVDLSFVLPVEIGQYVLVHAGFALHHVDEEEALRTQEILKDAPDLFEEENFDDFVNDTAPRFLKKNES